MATTTHHHRRHHHPAKPQATQSEPGNERETFINAIAAQEGNSYTAVNPDSGALGKYQVIPANVRAWTKRALGYSLTPAQFLANPDAQEKTARYVLGGYYDKYGPRGAAAAWYAGEGNHKLYNDDSPQPNGPSIHDYVQSVLRRMAGKPPTTATGSTGPATPTTSTNAAGKPNDWIGTIDDLMQYNGGGFSLNPLADVKDTGEILKVLAVRSGFAAMGLILFGAGLLIAFGPTIFGGAVRRSPAGQLADAANDSGVYDKEYDRESARQTARRDARQAARDAEPEPPEPGRHAQGVGRRRAPAAT